MDYDKISHKCTVSRPHVEADPMPVFNQEVKNSFTDDKLSFLQVDETIEEDIDEFIQ